MTAPNRVDELRKRYHENPRRFFAPLANEYRKTGFVDRAILLCEKHLGEQPGNMNGLVVYGQCLFETGRLEEARQPFEMALSVDPENLIALRHLGDIARLGGDAPAARGWYEKVLEFDRRNEEVVALMAEVGGAPEKAAATSSQAPNIVSVAGSVRVATPSDVPSVLDLAPSIELPSAPTPVPIRQTSATPRPTPLVDHSAKTVEVSAQARPAKRASLLDVSFDFGEIGVEAAPAAVEALRPIVEPAIVEPPMAEPPIVEPPSASRALQELPAIEGLEQAVFSADVAPLSGLESDEFQPLAPDEALVAEPLGLTFDDPFGDSAPAPLSAPSSAQEVAPETASPAALPEWPEALDDDLALSDAPEDSHHSGSGPDPRASVAGLPLLSPYGTPTPMQTPSVRDLPLLPSLEEAETIPIDLETARRAMETPATFVTETMAQVYVQQGHTDKAVAVYRQLISQSPGDLGLQARLHALEHPAAAAPAEVELTPVDELLPEMEPMPEPPSVSPTASLPISPSAAGRPSRPSLGFDTPLSSEPVDEPAPANAMLKATSFDGISLSTPAVAPRSTAPRMAVPVETGPSAREFFSKFAHRAATPSWTPSVEGAPTVGGQLMSPLDDLFGSAVAPEDEVAAHRLAGIGATSGPSGGTALDSLFGEGPSAPMPSSTPSRGTVPRASEKLRFDQFFASSTSVEGSIDTPTPPVAHRPEAASEPQHDMDGAPDDAGSDEPGEDDDLDQFQGWLRGLTS